jgi:hypothetical protein
MSDLNVCRGDFRGDGEIDKELQVKWQQYIDQTCIKQNCSRRYTTFCCNWGRFQESLK